MGPLDKDPRRCKVAVARYRFDKVPHLIAVTLQDVISNLSSVMVWHASHYWSPVP